MNELFVLILIHTQSFKRYIIINIIRQTTKRMVINLLCSNACPTIYFKKTACRVGFLLIPTYFLRKFIEFNDNVM